MKTLRILLTLMVITLPLAGCRKEPPPAPAPAPEPTPAARPADDSAQREAEERARREAEERERREAAERSRRALEAKVFFDYDEASIRADAKAILDAKLPVLRDNSAIRIRIEGHCDERGSNEYNIALGSRRAESIRSYLTDAGIAASRLEVVSYGEERPAASGSSESAWSQNRRGEFRILSGMGG